jgi:PAS domain S-box-containing protein
MPSQNFREAVPNGGQFETQLQATLNIIPAYTWYAARSGALTFVNERCADYLGLPTDHPLRFGVSTDAESDSHIPLLHPDDHEGTRRVWSTCLSSGSAGEVSFRVRSAEGSYRWFLSRAEPLRSSDGTLLYWIGINLDIEKRKKAEFYLAEGRKWTLLSRPILAGNTLSFETRLSTLIILLFTKPTTGGAGGLQAFDIPDSGAAARGYRTVDTVRCPLLPPKRVGSLSGIPLHISATATTAR